MSVSKILLVAAGFLFLAMGIAGIILPILPATPFLLAASFCFLKGSARLHRRLMSDPRIGPRIERIRTRGLTRREKISIYLTASACIIPVIVLSHSLHLRVFLVLLLAAKAIVFLLIRTAAPPPRP
ncbi:MAG: YbaN family protein [Treponema sp.]|jgi:uncharacterized membrane protein YbaN (DUF454 family)|nr:YbaN family protein [Treponema sp.]